MVISSSFGFALEGPGLYLYGASSMYFSQMTPPVAGLSPFGRTYSMCLKNALKNAHLVEEYVLPWQLDELETEHRRDVPHDGAKTRI